MLLLLLLLLLLSAAATAVEPKTQVHAIIRHGARGPYIKPKCWEGYDMRWDCNITEASQPKTHALRLW